MKKVLICVGIWAVLFIMAYVLPVQFTAGRERWLMMLFFLGGMGMLALTGYFVYKTEKKNVPVWRYMLSNFIVLLLLVGGMIQFFTLKDLYYKRKYNELSRYGAIAHSVITSVHTTYGRGHITATYLSVRYKISGKTYNSEIALNGDYTSYEAGDTTAIICSSRHPRIAEKYWED